MKIETEWDYVGFSVYFIVLIIMLCLKTLGYISVSWFVLLFFFSFPYILGIGILLILFLFEIINYFILQK